MKESTGYGDLPREFCGYADSSVVILPVKYDQTSTWGKGADKGPEAIIEASAHMELYDIETESQVYERGIFTAQAVKGIEEPGEMVKAVREEVTSYLNENKFVVVLGGEHSVSIGSVDAFCKQFDNLTVLQLDAHSDLRDEYDGSKFNHACVMARVKESCPIVQVGIRSMDISEKKSVETDRIFFAKDIHNNSGWVAQVISRLSENVYITIDLDVFDPSVMPSTGTPEPGGLLWYDIIHLLKVVIKSRNVVGCDVVELCPQNDNPAPNFLAAKLIYKVLSYKFGNEK